MPAETSTRAIEEAFKDFINREDIAVILINQYVRRARGSRSGSTLTLALLCLRLRTWCALWWTPTPRYGQLLHVRRRGLIRLAQPVPAVLEIPSKDRPYDPSKVRGLLVGAALSALTESSYAGLYSEPREAPSGRAWWRMTLFPRSVRSAERDN